jgi:hypothetical protein
MDEKEAPEEYASTEPVVAVGAAALGVGGEVVQGEYVDEQECYPSASAAYISNDKAAEVSFIDPDFYDVIECLLHDSDDDFDFGYSPVAMPIAAAATATTAATTAATRNCVPLKAIPYAVPAVCSAAGDMRCMEENYGDLYGDDMLDALFCDIAQEKMPAKLQMAAKEVIQENESSNGSSNSSASSSSSDSKGVYIVLADGSKNSAAALTSASAPENTQPHHVPMNTNSTAVMGMPSTDSKSKKSKMESGKAAGGKPPPSAARKLAISKRARVNGKFKRTQNKWVSATDFFKMNYNVNTNQDS